MNRSRGVLVILSCMLAALAGVVAAPVAEATPGYLYDTHVDLDRNSDLMPGDKVVASMHDGPAKQVLDVTVCDYLLSNGSSCETVGTVKTNRNGFAKTRVTVPGHLVHTTDIGSYPVFCRADNCQVFFSMQDQGETIWAQSDALQVVGSPTSAQYRHDPASKDPEKYLVSGTAYGAEGREVVITQEACESELQNTYCSYQGPRRTTKVRSDGSFVRGIPLRAGSCDAGESQGPLDRYCIVTAIVLDSHGQPDLSFGDPGHGDPYALYTSDN